MVSNTRRYDEIAAQIVDLRTLPHSEAQTVRGAWVKLDPALLYPKEAWIALKLHEQRWLMSLAAGMTSRNAVLCGRSAARLHHMWVIGPEDEPLELALPTRGTSAGRVSRGYVYRRSGMRPDEITEASGCKVTTPFRTFADIARYHGFVEGLIAADYLMQSGYTESQMKTQLFALGRVKGIATVRRCVEHAVGDSQSAYESFARALLIDAAVGTIQTQAPIRGYFADLLIDGWLVIEIDGAVKYSGPDAERVRQREFERQKVIGNLGYVFLRFTPEQIRRDPQGCVDQVRAALAARGRLIPGA